MNSLSKLLLTTVLCAGVVSPVFAADPENASASAKTTQNATSMSEGEIRKVDKSARKITIKHGPLTNLDMPAMTMVFLVKDVSVLNQVKPGDKISFIAERVNGQITVTQLEVMK